MPAEHIREVSGQVNGRGKDRHRPAEVLFFIDSLWGLGGAEVSLARLVRAMPPDRFRCRVVTFHANEKGLALIEPTGSPVYYWQMLNLYGSNAFAVARKIRKMVREEGIDIVHTYFQTSDLWAGPIARLSGARYLISSRRDMGILRQTKHQVGYRLLHGAYDQVHAVSESVRQYTIETDRMSPDKVVTVYNGIEINGAPSMSAPERIRLRESMGFTEDQIIVITVANWREVKGIDILVDAAAKVVERDPRVRFLVVGSLGVGPIEKAYSDSVLAAAKSSGVDRFTTFLGSSDDVRGLLEISDIFASPSRSEGLSNALLEAMESGLPCVATTVGGNPEIIVDGVTGLLVPSEDPDRLAEALLSVAADENRARMGAAGRQRVIERFAVDTMANQVIASYETLLAKDS